MKICRFTDEMSPESRMFFNGFRLLVTALANFRRQLCKPRAKPASGVFRGNGVAPEVESRHRSHAITGRGQKYFFSFG